MPISEQIREELKKPFGKVCNTHEMLIEARSAKGLVISVGDRCTYDLLRSSVHPHICIFDFRCMREPIGKGMQSFLEQARSSMRAVQNPAGEITRELKEAVQGALSKEEGTILIEGEDDLASLLVMAHAPIGSLLIYGQPNVGAVLVKIDEEKRKAALAFLEQIK